MKRVVASGLSLLLPFFLIACGANNLASYTPVPPTTAPTNNSSYPKLGHAPDYSWIAGWVSITKIQGGCIYIRTDAPPATPGIASTPGISGPVVSTAVHSDTSPPLSEITPLPQSVPTPDLSLGMFVPGGDGWNPTQWKDGDYVVAFGHVAGPDEPREMCPGGAQYVIDRVQANPR